MHSVEELGTNVPAFLAKLWKMVEDPQTNDLICWSQSGSSFFIRNQARFSRELLPLYYKHNNMASFVRQLNMYGFHKVVSIEGGGLKIDRDEMEFAHQYFLTGHPYLLEHIKRKIPTNKAEEARSGTKSELVNKVLSEVKSLKGRQDDVDSQLSAMKRENEVLWREVAILRQKHLKQQQIVNKLIHFLVSMVQTSRGSGIGIKRHYPLMLNDINHHVSKTAKHNGNITDINSLTNDMSPTGPVIHEIDPADLLDDCNPSIGVAISGPEFLTSDLCDPVNSESENDKSSDVNTVSASSTESNAATLNVNDPLLNDANHEVLLELAEECPEMLLVTPNSASSFVTSVKPPKGKQKTSLLKGGKRRKSRPSSTLKNNALLSIKTEREDEEDLVNVNNFLEVMMPTLVAGDREGNNENSHQVVFTRAEVPTTTATTTPVNGTIYDLGLPILEVITDDGTIDKAQENSVQAANDEAISAIRNAAAAAAVAAATAETEAAASISPATVESKSPTPSKEEGKTKTNIDSQRTSDEVSNKDLALACTGVNNIDTLKSKEELDAHLDSMQAELESLKEMMKGDNYSFDNSMLLGVCAAGLGLDANTLKLFADDQLTFSLPIVEENAEKNSKENGISDPMVSGNELTTYSSNLLDLADMSGLEDWASTDGCSDFQTDNTDNSEVTTPQVVMANSPSFSGSIAKKKKK